MQVPPLRLVSIVIALCCVQKCLTSQMTDAQLEKILADNTLMERHLRCALGQGVCDELGRRLRTLAPLVLRGSCPQCSPLEARQIRRALAHVQRHYPWHWSQMIRQHG